MSLFKKNIQKPSTSKPVREKKPGGKSSKKGKPTPKRKYQEAKNFRPQVAGDRKAAKAREREARNKAFLREQEGLRTGQEHLLPMMHRGQERRFVRNWLDARYTFCEWMIIVVLGFMLGGVVLAAMAKNKETAILISNTSMIIAYAVLIFGIGEAIILMILATRKAREKFEQDKDFPRGLRWYTFSRAILIRRWRSPRPQVRRGEKIS